MPASPCVARWERERGRDRDQPAMRFIATELADAQLIEPEEVRDERGFFARVWCSRELEAQGLSNTIAQVNVSHNARKGTVRGLHYQVAPHDEIRVLRCTHGAIYDVIVDLRPGSPTHAKWLGVTLSAANRRMLYVPEGFAHGFQTLQDDTEVLYLMSSFYEPGAGRGVRWNDPAFAIEWPLPVSVISERDATFGDFETERSA